MESNAGSEMEDVRAVANRDHQAGTGVELSFKQGPSLSSLDLIRSVRLTLLSLQVN